MASRRPTLFGIQHGGNRRHDQVAEHQQHAGNRHRRGDDEAERGVEEEVPEPDRDALGFGAVRVHRDREEPPPEHVVKDADGAVQHRGLPDFGPRDGKDVADEHVLQVFALGGGLAHGQNRRRRRDRVADPDDGFLRNARALAADRREHERADEREGEADPVHDRRVRDRRRAAGRKIAIVAPSAAICASDRSTKITPRSTTWTPR